MPQSTALLLNAMEGEIRAEPSVKRADLLAAYPAAGFVARTFAGPSQLRFRVDRKRAGAFSLVVAPEADCLLRRL